MNTLPPNETRAHLSGIAMGALIPIRGGDRAEVIAVEAVKFADALLAELSKPEHQGE